MRSRWVSGCSHYNSHLALLGCQNRATTLTSRPPAPPEPELWACCGPWSTWIWWTPLLKLAHNRLLESLGANETSGPAPSRDSVPKQTKQRTGETRLQQSQHRDKKGRVVFHYLFCVEMVSSVSRGVTCCMLIPDFDRAVMGGCSHSSCATRMHGEKHTAGCGLEVASVLHNFAARLTQVPKLVTHRHKSTHHKSQCFMFQKHRQNQWSVWDTVKKIIWSIFHEGKTSTYITLYYTHSKSLY